MFIRRRRPMLRAAMIGGTAIAVGRNAARNRQREAQEEARLDALEQDAAPPADSAPSELTRKLTELKGLMDQGVLTAEEFTAAKQKLLAG
jgi:Short C-terminal domain